MNNSGSSNRVALRRVLVPGQAQGRVLVLGESLSFWGGLNPDTGCIIDVHHPQCGECVTDTLLVLPGVRGSTAGPGALLECLYAQRGPSAIIIAGVEDISSLIAATVYSEITDKSVPIVEICHADVGSIESGKTCCLVSDALILGD